MVPYNQKQIEALRAQIINKITEEREALASYKRLCARFQIAPDRIPERVVSAKLDLLENFLKDITLLTKQIQG